MSVYTQPANRSELSNFYLEAMKLRTMPGYAAQSECEKFQSFEERVAEKQEGTRRLRDLQSQNKAAVAVVGLFKGIDSGLKAIASVASYLTDVPNSAVRRPAHLMD